MPLCTSAGTVALEQRTVRQDDTLKIEMPNGGGFVALFTKD